jgi:hypothetical protein
MFPADGVPRHRDPAAVEALLGAVGDDPLRRGIALLDRDRVARLR